MEVKLAIFIDSEVKLPFEFYTQAKEPQPYPFTEFSTRSKEREKLIRHKVETTLYVYICDNIYAAQKVIDQLDSVSTGYTLDVIKERTRQQPKHVIG